MGCLITGGVTLAGDLAARAVHHELTARLAVVALPLSSLAFTAIRCGHDAGRRGDH